MAPIIHDVIISRHNFSWLNHNTQSKNEDAWHNMDLRLESYTCECDQIFQLAFTYRVPEQEVQNVWLFRSYGKELPISVLRGKFLAFPCLDWWMMMSIIILQTWLPSLLGSLSLWCLIKKLPLEFQANCHRQVIGNVFQKYFLCLI